MSSYEFFIARRYLKSKRKTGFISIITYLSIGGVAVGVAALIIVLSLMNGFASEVRSRIVGMDAHIRVVLYHHVPMREYRAIAARVRGMRHVVGVSPFVADEALAMSEKGGGGIVLKGVEGASVDSVSDVRTHVLYGQLGFDPSMDVPGIVIGNLLADRLQVTLGDNVYVATPQNIRPDAMWTVPKMRRFVVTGIFETGFYDFDAALALVSIGLAQQVFGFGDGVSGLEVKLDDLYVADRVAKELDDALDHAYWIRPWMEMRKHLFSWMTIEKWGSFIVLSLIVVVAAFNIISTLIMVVMEKTKEIGILKSMGATARSIKRIFVLEGLVVGFIGTPLGCLIGFLLCWIQDRYTLISLPSDIYIISAVPVDMRPWDFLWISTASLGICFLATLYPSSRAASLDPVEAIRYE